MQLLCQIEEQFVAIGIAIGVVDQMEAANTKHKYIHGNVLAMHTLHLIKKLINIIKAGNGINIFDDAVILNSTNEQIRLFTHALQAVTVTGASNIIAVGVLSSVFQIVVQGFAIEHIADIIQIGLAVIGMDALQPNIARVKHILTGQVKVLDNALGPTGHVGAHVAHIQIAMAHGHAQGIEHTGFQTIIVIKNTLCLVLFGMLITELFLVNFIFIHLLVRSAQKIVVGIRGCFIDVSAAITKATMVADAPLHTDYVAVVGLFQSLGQILFRSPR